MITPIETKTRTTVVSSNVSNPPISGKIFKEPEQDRQKSDRYKPKTALGMKLWKLRQQIVASGPPLLNWDELEQEIGKRKGEQEGYLS